MGARLIVGAIAALAFVPAAAAAQDRRWLGEIGMGPTVVYGPAGDRIGPGFNFDAGVMFKVSDIFAVKADTLVTRHDVNDDITSQLDVGDGNAWMWHFSGNGVLSTPMSNRVSLYTVGGLGVYYRKVSLTNPGIGFVTVCDPWLLICYPTAVPSEQIVGERSTTDFGMNAGAGVNFRLGENAGLFAEFRFHYVWGPKISAEPDHDERAINSQFMPFTFGVRF